MDAMIGRYRACMEPTGLVLRHATGISFDLSIDETLGLLNFLNAYHQTLLTLQERNQERDTEPRMERIVIHKDS
jgi:hypothetical protein